MAGRRPQRPRAVRAGGRRADRARLEKEIMQLR